jgi:hypothetical protein
VTLVVIGERLGERGSVGDEMLFTMSRAAARLWARVWRGVMADDVHELLEEGGEDQRQSPPVAQGGVVYGLGFIGALVWFWKQADGPEEHVLGVLKAVVWPAFLVYEAFKVLHSSGE